MSEYPAAETIPALNKRDSNFCTRRTCLQSSVIRSAVWASALQQRLYLP